MIYTEPAAEARSRIFIYTIYKSICRKPSVLRAEHGYMYKIYKKVKYDIKNCVQYGYFGFFAARLLTFCYNGSIIL